MGVPAASSLRTLKQRGQRTWPSGSVYRVVLPSCGQGLAIGVLGQDVTAILEQGHADDTYLSVLYHDARILASHRTPCLPATQSLMLGVCAEGAPISPHPRDAGDVALGASGIQR
jgi:hypothetical protein